MTISPLIKDVSGSQLPEIDGWTLTTESEGNIPAIALASDSIKRDRNTAWLLGFQMLLSQPLAKPALCAYYANDYAHHK